MSFFKSLFGLKQSKKSGPESSVRGFIHLLLFQAQQDQATELVIGLASPSQGVSIRYKVENAWYEMSPFPVHIRPDVVAELVRMAKFHA